MLSVLLILTLLLGAVVSLGAGDRGTAARAVAATSLALTTLVAAGMLATQDPLQLTFNAPWIPTIGARLILNADALAAVMCGLTGLVGLAAVAADPFPDDRPGVYGFALLSTMAALCGVFLARDLLLFFSFFEAMLIPAWLILSTWGRGDRATIANRFFLYTQAGGLVMLLATSTLAYVHHRQTGVWTFAIDELATTFLSPAFASLLLLAFVAAFAVKLPAFPLHTWQADTYASLPTGAAMVFAGLLSKAGAYGLLRVAIPLFPSGLASVAPALTALGAVGVIFGGVLAFSQNDLRRLLAYLSLSHLGLVMIGAFAWTGTSIRGVAVMMVAHALSTAGLFAVVGMIERRTGSTDLDQLGGLWAKAPRLTFVAMFFALASLGLPGLGNFIAEFLILAGSWPSAPWATAIGQTGVLLATLSCMGLVHRAFMGKPTERAVEDLDGLESMTVVAMMAGVLLVGLGPQSLLDAIEPAVSAVVQGVTR
jgi:NADH-quinone oxidoreductase subunit M